MYFKLKWIKKLFTLLQGSSNRLVIIVFTKLLYRPLHRASIKPRQRPIHHLAKHDKVQIDTLNIHIYQWGSSDKLILCLHGWESRSICFSEMIQPLLQDGYSIISFDMPGHGESDGFETTIFLCDQICAYLNERYGQFEACIGHSLGCLCLFYTVKRTLKTKKIIMISPLAEFSYHFQYLCHKYKIKPHLRRVLAQKVESMLLPIENIWEKLSIQYESGLVTQPMLIVHDQHDKIINISQAQKIFEVFTHQAELLITSGYGHTRILSQTFVIEKIRLFISS
jgi:pimeloyl-ACP methyl ester carboxylesterase